MNALSSLQSTFQSVAGQSPSTIRAMMAAQVDISVLTGSNKSEGSGSAFGASSTQGTSVTDVVTDGDETGIKKLAAALHNRQELYTVQLSELSKYRAAIDEVHEDAKGLEALNDSSSAEDVKASLHKFADSFNAMQKRFAANFEDEGTFHDLQAAEVAKFSMERELDSVFNGSAKLGFGGLHNAGIDVDEKTGMMTIDDAALDTALAKDKSAVVSGINQMTMGFEKTTAMLTSDGKFIDNRQHRLSDALQWLKQNLPGVDAQAAAAGGYQSQGQAAASAYRQVASFGG